MALQDIDLLNRLLAEESRCSDIYEAVLKKSAKDAAVWNIVEIATRHRQTAGRLRREIQARGGEVRASTALLPDVQRDEQLKLSEDKSALRGLRQCELTVIETCEKALRTDHLDPSTRTLLSYHILPALKRHVEILNHYLGDET